jgi:S-adenosylmethionine synthetase
MELSIRTVHGPAPGTQPLEIVERKGIGHPDTMCDGIAERVCVRLCRHYRERFGAILHHNVDKVLLVGGVSRAAFGGGELTVPLEVYLAGRVTTEHRGEHIPADSIAIDACRDWLREHLRFLDADRDVKIIPRFRPGSPELSSLVGRVRANDTSCGVGFAPATDLERTVLAVEKSLNAADTKRVHPEIGEDVKVMGVRHGGEIVLTIGCAFVGRHVVDLDDYARKKSGAAALALEAARVVTALDVKAFVNLGDDLDRGDVYLTVTGTSAECGDDGEVGRGNRVGGLITPHRPMTLEAAAGKNPVSHVGKLYSVVARRIAESIARETEDVLDARCFLVSQIGRPVDDPQMADVRIVLGHAGAHHLRRHVENCVHRELGALDAIREELLAEHIALF